MKSYPEKHISNNAASSNLLGVPLIKRSFKSQDPNASFQSNNSRNRSHSQFTPSKNEIEMVS